MLKKWDKKILCVLMQWEYCDKSRGVSGDKTAFFDAISQAAENVEAFWYDDYVSDFATLRRLAYEKAESFNPDLIFFSPYTGQFDTQSLEALKKRWPTCAWFGDDTWRFGRYSSKLAPHFTYVCTTDSFSVGKYNELGIDPIVTQWAAVPPAGAVQLPPPEGYRFDVSFVGGKNPVREWFVDALSERGINVECFGYGWPNGVISLSQMQDVFRTSKINLNLSNSTPRDLRFLSHSPLNFARYLRSPKAAEQIKARNFEIPLSGGFQLTNYVAGLERYLQIGREVAAYSSPEECAAQIDYYLRNHQERRAIAAAGQARASAEHTYRHRFESIFKRIWS